MAEPLIFRIPDPADEELREREPDAEASETEAEEAHVSAGGQRMRQHRAKIRAHRIAELLFLFAKTSDNSNRSVSFGTQREGNFLFCVVEVGQGCVKQLGAKEHLNQQDAWRARKLKFRDREKHAQQMSVKDSDSESVLRKCCLKSFFRFRKAVQLGPAQAAAAGAWCRVLAAANQGMATPDVFSLVSARLAVLPAGQAQWGVAKDCSDTPTPP